MPDMVPIRPQMPVGERQLFGPRDLVYVAFRRRRWILAIWLPILLVGALGLFKHTGAFVASSKVLLELQSSQSPTLVISNRQVDYDLAISTYSHLAMSVPVAEIAAATLTDSLDILREIDPKYGQLAQHDKMLEFILDKLVVARVAESNLLDIRYTSPYERVALMVDRAVRDAFFHYSLNAVRNSSAISYYDEQLQDAESEIDSLLAIREQVSKETGVSMLNQDSRSDAALLSQLESEYYRVSADVVLKESTIANLRAAVAENPDFVPAGAADLASMRVRVENEQETYSKLLAEHPETSQMVQRQAGVLTDLRSQMRQAVKEYIDSLDLEARALRDKASVVKRQMDGVNATVAALPSAYRRITMLDAQITAKSEFLQSIQIKSGEVRLSQMADERVSRLTRITEPEIDTVISEARKFAFFGALAIFGLALGLLVGVVVDRGDQRIHDVRVLSESVDVPVLGSISVGKR
jgi:uncharacterized protein involved in exopolysaccharide biosynthesis